MCLPAASLAERLATFATAQRHSFLAPGRRRPVQVAPALIQSTSALGTKVGGEQRVTKADLQDFPRRVANQGDVVSVVPKPHVEL